MSRFALGLLLCLPVPALYGRLRHSAAVHDGPAPTDVAVARTGGLAAAALLPEQPAVAPAVLVVKNRPSDPQPVVTPEGAKAGGIRRAVQGTPCHGCRCCEVYSARLADAHREIDRLRDELVADGCHRINQYPRQPVAGGGQ